MKSFIHLMIIMLGLAIIIGFLKYETDTLVLNESNSGNKITSNLVSVQNLPKHEPLLVNDLQKKLKPNSVKRQATTIYVKNKRPKRDVIKINPIPQVMVDLKAINAKPILLSISPILNQADQTIASIGEIIKPEAQIITESLDKHTETESVIVNAEIKTDIINEDQSNQLSVVGTLNNKDEALEKRNETDEILSDSIELEKVVALVDQENNTMVEKVPTIEKLSDNPEIEVIKSQHKKQVLSAAMESFISGTKSSTAPIKEISISKTTSEEHILNRPEEKIEKADLGIKSDELNNNQILFDVALMSNMAGEHQKAMQLYEIILNNKPDHKEAMYNLAMSKIELNDVKNGCIILKKSLKLGVQNAKDMLDQYCKW